MYWTYSQCTTSRPTSFWNLWPPRCSLRAGKEAENQLPPGRDYTTKGPDSPTKNVNFCNSSLIEAIVCERVLSQRIRTPLSSTLDEEMQNRSSFAQYTAVLIVAFFSRNPLTKSISLSDPKNKEVILLPTDRKTLIFLAHGESGCFYSMLVHLECYCEPMSRHPWQCVTENHNHEGHIVAWMTGHREFLCLVVLGNPNRAIILDTVPCERPKTSISSFTVASMFSSIASSTSVALAALPAVVSLLLRDTSLVVQFKFLHPVCHTLSTYHSLHILPSTDDDFLQLARLLLVQT